MGKLWSKNVLPYKETTLAYSAAASDESMQYILNHDDYAYVTLDTTPKMSPLYPCDIAEMEEVFFRVQNTFGYQKDWPLRDLFNYWLNQIITSGMLSKIRKK